MELLKKCQDLIGDLEELNHKHDQLKEKQLESDNLEKKEKYYVAQFNLCMDIASVYEDLMERIDVLEKQENMEFICNRFRKRAEGMMKSGVIEVKR